MKAELEQERERREKKRDERKEAKERRDKEETKKSKESTPSSSAGAGAGASACVYAYGEHPTVADEQATGRIFASLDYDADEKKFRQKINNRLRHLSRPQRAFARAVLNGVTWREMGMAKQTFCFTLKKIEKILKGP